MRRASQFVVFTIHYYDDQFKEIGDGGTSAFMGEMGTVYRILIRKPNLKRPPETSRRE